MSDLVESARNARKHIPAKCGQQLGREKAEPHGWVSSYLNSWPLPYDLLKPRSLRMLSRAEAEFLRGDQQKELQSVHDLEEQSRDHVEKGFHNCGDHSITDHVVFD